MSDPVNKPRQPVDLDEFERRLRGVYRYLRPGESLSATASYQPAERECLTTSTSLLSPARKP